jgi:lipid-binding SYLF domain-containing protein
MMMKYDRRTIVVGWLGLLASATVATPALAEVGAVSVVFTKGGFIVGVGGGEGVLTFRGHHYPFTVSGASIGFTIGASTTKLVGRALNIRSPGDIAGSYSVVGAGAAVAAGARGERGAETLDLGGLLGGQRACCTSPVATTNLRCLQ